jgi:hypothetical protein
MIAELLKDLPKDIQKRMLMSILENSAKRFGDMTEDKQMELVDTLQKLNQELGDSLKSMTEDKGLIMRCLAHVETHYAKEAQTDAQTAV